MTGNKTDNGVLEVGTDEVRVSYSEDTPGQYVDAFIKEQEKAFHEQEKKVKKNFSSVFQNPLKGFPYNEEIIVKPLQETNWGYVFYNKKSLDKFLADPYIKSVTKKVTIDKAKFRGGKSGFDVGIESDADLGLNPLAKKVEKIKKKYGRSGVDYAHVEHDGESILEANLQEGTWAVPDSYKKLYNLQVGFLTNKKAATELNSRKLLVDLYGIFGDDSLYDDVGEYIDTPNPKFDLRDLLVKHLKPFGIKINNSYKITHAPEEWIDNLGKSESKIEERLIEGMPRRGRGNIKKPKGKMVSFVMRKENKEKEAVTEGKYLRYSDLLLKKAREMDAIDKAQDKSGVKNPSLNAIKKINKEIEKEMKKLGIKEAKQSFEEWQEAKSKMSGSKLTGAEISSYFRKHKVRDKTVRKAVEIALDHGGAMNYAIKQIEKLKRGLSKHKDVEKALEVANFGEHVSEQDVEKFFGFFTENLNEETAFQTMQDIVKNKQAQKIKGVMVDMFTASVVVQAYNKVNDSNKKKIEKANLDVLVKLAHKVMGMKEEIDLNFITASLEEAPVLPSTQAGQMQGDHSIEDGVRKYEEVINKQYQSGRFAKLHKERGSKVVARKASKYYRVENHEMGKAGSIHAFIEISTGDIFKPASFKAPAKGARGNVTDQRYIDYVAKYPDAYYGGHLYK
jgi:hypothetical protein